MSPRSLLIAGMASALALAMPAHAQSAADHPEWPGANALFVGACYQPIDRSPEQIRQDIAIMKAAGFTMVRMGDLSWDSFEPEEGRFTFDWFDKVIEQMHAAGIRVIVDIPGEPAPIWLHKHYPGVDIINQDGNRINAASRYWDDISDPDYRRLARRLAEKMMARYAHNPAVIAVGYDNEVGNGHMSYSPADRARFVDWLKQRYGTLEALNKAWATQRWSRRIGDWSEVDLPYEHRPGPNERNLDLHRFWSDDTIGALEELEAVRKRFAPNLPVASNLWPTGGKSFDYLRSWDRISTYGAQGFYPGEPVSAAFEAMSNRAGHTTPLWFNEFTAGGGGYYGTPGRSRMWAYFGLIYYAQTFLAWTFNSHIGGEEQALFGLLDHDSRPSWKVAEFAQIAREFQTMKTLGFPRYRQPEVAVNFSFQSFWITNPPPGPNTMPEYFRGDYTKQAQAAYRPFFEDNVDAAVIDVGHDRLDRYKLVVLPSAFVMDEPTAAAVRRYVANGGTVIMTGYSAKVDETGKWFETPLPGRLTDVFGIRTNAFYRAEQPLRIDFGGATLTGSDPYYEVVELGTATSLATIANQPEHSPAITVNRFGKGRAIYLATAPQAELLGPLVRSLYARLGITVGPHTPPGVIAREVDHRILYVNTTAEKVAVPLPQAMMGVLSRKSYDATLVLDPYQVELLRP